MHQRPVTNTTTQSFGLHHYSLDGSGETPGGHQSSSTSRSRRGNRARHDTHSHQSTRQRSPENESSQLVSPPPQIPRTPAIRPLRQAIPGWQLSDPIAIPPRRPSDGSSSQLPPLPFFSDSSWDDYVSDDTIANYRAIGAQHQAWIAGPTTTSCPIERSRVTWEDLIHNPLEEHSFEVYLNDLRSTPEEVGNIASTGLSTGRNWRYVFLRQWGHWDGGRQEGYTVYQHRTGLGAIFVENITRRFGPYWSQVAEIIPRCAGGSQDLPEEGVVDVATAVEAELLLQWDQGGDVIRCSCGGLSGECCVQVVYVCLVVLLMVQLHYLLGDDGLQRLLIVSFMARSSVFVIGRGLHRRRRAKEAECEFEKTWWNCRCKCV